MTSIDHDNYDDDDEYHHQDNDHHEEEEEEEEIVLPGYDAGVNESGVKHSQLKLKESAKRLSLKLSEIIDQNRNQTNDHEEEEGIDDENENENSSSRTTTTTTTTTTQTIGIQTFSCLNEEETLTYRCRCNFQIVQIPAIIPVTTTASSSLSLLLSSSPSSSFRYALRSKGQPVLLGTKNSFPIATRRIQSAMKEFMDYINNSDNSGNENNNENNSNNAIITTTSSIANKYLTSCTFSSAWNDLPDADCVLTLNYDQQYLDLDLDNNDNENGNNRNKIAWRWKQEAQLLCQKLHLRQINGRSKGTLLSVRGGGGGGGNDGDKNNNSSHGCNDDDDNANDKSDEKEATIRDTVYIFRSDSCNNDNDNDKTSTMKVKWNVSLEGRQQQQQRPTGGSVTTVRDRSNDDTHNNNDVNDDANNKSTIITTTIFPVHYEKPETAFYHPNPNAMTKALAWMLDRLTCISISKQDANNDISKLKLLEMYCGCGAHTVALGRSGLVSQILAIELDPRLVRSCEKNISLNGLQNLIQVYRGDAGRWSKEESRRRRRNRQRSRAFVEIANSDSRMRNNNNDDDDNGSCNYDVLLVDPPRQGLDEEVCRMAMMTMSDDDDNNNDDNKVHGTSSGDDNNNSSHGSGGCFQNILYVSCGHQALLRDLERLSPVYEVVNCAQMDLFPRTDSIETLVHLRKRTTTFT